MSFPQEKFEADMKVKKKELINQISARSSAEFEELGRLFHYHLLVEDALVKFIRTENPKIGKFEKGATQFMNKLQIAQNMENGDLLSVFNGPLQKLNEIRNKMGHHPLKLAYPPEEMKEIRKYFETHRDVTKLRDIDVILQFSVEFYSVISAICVLNEMRDKAQAEQIKADTEYKGHLEAIVGFLKTGITE